MLCILCRHNLLGDCLAELRLRLCCTAMLAMRCYPAGTGLADMHVNMKGVQRPVEETIFPNTMLEKRVVINSSVVAKQPSWQESHRSRCCPTFISQHPLSDSRRVASGSSTALTLAGTCLGQHRHVPHIVLSATVSSYHEIMSSSGDELVSV